MTTARRIATIFCLAAFFSSASGLILALHEHEAGSEHNRNDCSLCITVANGVSTAPVSPITLVITEPPANDSPACQERQIVPTSPHGDPISPRAPPVA